MEQLLIQPATNVNITDNLLLLIKFHFTPFVRRSMVMLLAVERVTQRWHFIHLSVTENFHTAHIFSIKKVQINTFYRKLMKCRFTKWFAFCIIYGHHSKKDVIIGYPLNALTTTLRWFVSFENNVRRNFPRDYILQSRTLVRTIFLLQFIPFVK